MSASQGLLFAEPAIAETGLWCELADGIDPARWAHLCRHLGNLTPEQLKKAEKRLSSDSDSFKNRFLTDVLLRSAGMRRILSCLCGIRNNLFLP